MAQTSIDVKQIVRDTGKGMLDSVTLGPQRRKAQEYVNQARDYAQNLYKKYSGTGVKASTQSAKPVASASPARRKTAPKKAAHKKVVTRK